MSDMKCPFCQQELETGNYYVHCHNPNCNITVEMEGTEEMWLALIRTRKALDVAKEGLKEIQDKGEYVNPIDIATSCLDEITALEQKDK